MTSPELGDLAAGGRLVILVPVGSLEPHGPHLPLATDTAISEGVCRRAAPALEAVGWQVAVAPPVSYGVTECAAGFPGAMSIPGAALTAFLRAILEECSRLGAAHACLVNNHLEPAHDAAVRAAADGLDPTRVSVVCPLERRFARTLSEEFKRGECHAGRYETALVLAERPGDVDDAMRAHLPEVPVSLSAALRAGVSDFVEMGLSRAYAGDPAAASAEEGEELFERLAAMLVAVVTERLGEPG
jgi:creatinine amidohydrolase